MSSPVRHHFTPPFSQSLPAPIVFRSAQLPARAEYPQHRHAWGEFVYSFSGVAEIKMGGQHYLVPPQYGFWLPPNVEHQGLNRYEIWHCSLYISVEYCAGMPQRTCALTVNPLVRVMLEHLRQHQPAPRPSVEEARLLQVLVDQLKTADCAGSYLPTSEDSLLNPLLQMLQLQPGDSRPLAELARSAHTTERTLMRRSQKELGMSLAEWRQRLRVVKAISLLETGETVENIAHDLGYSSASAFIAMFRRLMNITPDEYRKGL